MKGVLFVILHLLLCLVIASKETLHDSHDHDERFSWPFSGEYWSGEVSSEAGHRYLQLLDASRRMLSPGDLTLPTLSYLYDASSNGLIEGAQWGANFWTQNAYGLMYASLPFLEEPFRTWLQTSMNWWFDHMANGTQIAGDLFPPDGIMCDNGNPQSCNYKQCGPSRDTALGARHQNSTRVGDTPGVGHDWIIEGSLAAVLSQAELLLVTRDVDAIARYLPQFWRLSQFMESRRVPAPYEGVFQAGSGANLLAPAFGGWPLPTGCRLNQCSNRALSYLAALTVTYSAALDRMIELEQLAGDPAGRLALYRTRRQLNTQSLPFFLTTQHANETVNGKAHYFVRSVDPDGTVHGVYGAPSHGNFESAPNHDAIAFRVVDDTLAAEIYSAMEAIPQLRPCDFTIPNYPDYDDSFGENAYGYGTWVSGGSWSTAEGRMILAHYRVGRFDLAAASMSRILYPYAALFKLDNPIAKFGCGPGMYTAGPTAPPVMVLVDAYAIPAAFIRGLYEYLYTATQLTLFPRVPPGIVHITQDFPVYWGAFQLFLTMTVTSVDSTLSSSNITNVTVNGQVLGSTQYGNGSVVLPFAQLQSMGGTSFAVVISLSVPPSTSPVAAVPERRVSRSEQARRAPSPVQSHKSAADSRSPIKQNLLSLAMFLSNCSLSNSAGARVNHTIAFLSVMTSSKLNSTYEYAHGQAFLSAIEKTVQRCVGRQSGWLPPLPPQPADWASDNVTTNQTAADASFLLVALNLYDGLNTRISTYRESSDPVRQTIYKLWETTADGADEGLLDRAIQIRTLIETAHIFSPLDYQQQVASAHKRIPR